MVLKQLWFVKSYLWTCWFSFIFHCDFRKMRRPVLALLYESTGCCYCHPDLCVPVGVGVVSRFKVLQPSFFK